MIPLGWLGTFILGGMFVGGAAVGGLLTWGYWAKRFKFLFHQLQRLRAEQDLMNLHHTGEIDTHEFSRRLLALYEGPTP